MKLCSKHWTVRRGKAQGGFQVHVVRLHKPRTCRTRSVRYAEELLGILWFGQRDPETLMPLTKNGNWPA